MKFKNACALRIGFEYGKTLLQAIIELDPSPFRELPIFPAWIPASFKTETVDVFLTVLWDQQMSVGDVHDEIIGKILMTGHEEDINIVLPRSRSLYYERVGMIFWSCNSSFSEVRSH